jgi:hypothetical protein
MSTRRPHLSPLAAAGGLLLALACLAPPVRTQEPASSHLADFWQAAFHAPFDPGRSALLVDEVLAPGAYRVLVVELDDPDAPTILATDVLLAEIASFPIRLPSTSGHAFACAAAILSTSGGLEASLTLLTADVPMLPGTPSAQALHVLAVSEAWTDPNQAIERAEQRAAWLSSASVRHVLPPGELAAGESACCDDCSQKDTQCFNLANGAYDAAEAACIATYDAAVLTCISGGIPLPLRVLICLANALAAENTCLNTAEAVLTTAKSLCERQFIKCVKACGDC